MGGLTLWRLPCPACHAVCTGLPHCVLRDCQRRPEGARTALGAPHAGRRLAWGAVIGILSPLARSRLVCACGPPSRVTVLPRGGLPRPVDGLAAEKPPPCRADTVSLPTLGHGRVRWYLGETTEARAGAVTQSSGAWQRAAAQQEPSSRGTGGLTEGVDRPSQRRRRLGPGARLGPCRRHALLQRPQTLVAIGAPRRQARRPPCPTLWSRARQRTSRRGLALGQQGRPLAHHGATTAGTANGARGRRGLRDKQAGWDVVVADPQRPATRPLWDQAPNAMARQVFAMQGLPQPRGSPQAFLPGRAHLATLVPSQRRAQHAGQCSLAGAGGRVPTPDGLLTLPMLTSGGLRCAPDTLHYVIRWNLEKPWACKTRYSWRRSARRLRS